LPDANHRPKIFCQALRLVLLLTAAVAGNATAADICGYPERGTLSISRTAETVATLRVGLAENSDQYRKGLMGCLRLPDGTGLLFIYPDAQRRIFWMKDTPLELAIVFVSPDGRIMAIEEGRPYSTRRIRSPDNIQFVLEIQPAEADPIRIGDRVSLRLNPE
jgi:uncharacterized membrane protein (UPF0127 family)